MTLADELAVAVGRLVNQISVWTPPRWAASAAEGGGPAGGIAGVGPVEGAAGPGRTRAEVVHGLVRRLADLAADAEGEPRRPVPRLDTDLALPDQLRVVTADLLAANPDDEALSAGLAAVVEARRILR